MLNLTKIVVSVVLGFLCLVLPAMPSALAESLWSDTGVSANLYTDHKAHTTGDIVTIIISENSSANRVGKADNSKTTDESMNVNVGIFSSIAKMLGLNNPNPTASMKNSDNFAANGSIKNSNIVNARMTAQVTAVKPNGNLMISGTQSINQNGEEQKITVSGVVRTDDITSDNTVLSSLMGDAQIKIDGKGPISRKQRQGIITQLLNIFF